jgi:hypothetical protein
LESRKKSLLLKSFWKYIFFMQLGF